ncbi:MAG TPA: HlyD family type I secretion periplasmic adaptor subunit [Denitromonas sp.]|nr:HlyD family type I secretion periplasmic adaptor subunit [Denitromonas sp.]
MSAQAAQHVDEVAVAAPPAPDDWDDVFAVIDADRRRAIFFGFFIVLAGVLGLGSWAALAPLQSAVVAAGVVKVSTERKTVQHLESGIIKEILVKEGDKVAADQILIRLDDTNERARVGVMQGKLDRLRATLARLEAEQSGAQAIVFPPELTGRQNDVEISRLLASERQVFESRRDALAGEKEVLEQRNRQFAEQIAGLKTQIDSTNVQLSTIREEKDAVEILYKKGVYEKPRYLELKRSLARLQGQVGGHRSSIAQVEERIGEVHLRIIDLDRKRNEEVNTELQRVQNEIFDTRETLRAALNTLNRTDIRASQSGTVVGLNVHTVGGVIGSGQPILFIVPDGDVLVVEASVRPQDIDIVREGMGAEVRLTAFNSRNTPPLPGRVTLVSADSLPDSSGTQSFYRARIEIDPAHITDLELYPGMPAEVYLLTGEQTTLDYVLKPIEDAIQRALREE